jgi:hypothetical protein
MKLDEYLKKENIKVPELLKRVLRVAPCNFSLTVTALYQIINSVRYPSPIAAYWICKSTNFEVKMNDLLYPMERIMELEGNTTLKKNKKEASEVCPV